MSYFCFQGNNNDCGFASLKMMMAKYTRNKSYLYAPKPEKKEAYSFSDLIGIAKNYGFELDAYVSETRNVADLKDGSIVVINERHSVLVDRIKKNVIILLDPSEGKIVMKHKEFCAIWTGQFLEISEAKINEKFVQKKPQIIPFKFTILRIIISLGLLALLLLGFLFIDKSEFFIVSIIILSLIPLVEILDDIITLKITSYFDNKYIPVYFSHFSPNNKTEYFAYQDFKKKYLILYKVLSSSIILILFIGFIIAINDYRNLLISLVILLSVVVEKVLFMKSDKETKKSIAENEENALKNNSKIDIEILKKSNADANKFVRRKSYRKGFQILLCLFLTFVIMFIQNTVSANFLLFHFGIYYILFNNCDVVIDALFNYQTLKKDESRFRDKCNI